MKFVKVIEDFKSFQHALQQTDSKSNLTHALLYHVIIEDRNTGGQEAIMQLGTQYIMDIIIKKQEGRFIAELLGFLTRMED